MAPPPTDRPACRWCRLYDLALYDRWCCPLCCSEPNPVVSRSDETVRVLFDAFSRKGGVLHLLDQCLETDGIQLFIGQETGYAVVDDVSMLASPYEVNGQLAGVLGVVGPTRMAYNEVIPVIDVTAKLLGAALRQS